MKTYIAMIATRTNSFCQSREIQAADRLAAEDYAEAWAGRERQETGLAWYACPTRTYDERMEFADARRKAKQSAAVALQTWAQLMANVSTLSESPQKEAARATYHRLDQFTITDDVHSLAYEILASIIGPDPRTA